MSIITILLFGFLNDISRSALPLLPHEGNCTISLISISLHGQAYKCYLLKNAVFAFNAIKTYGDVEVQHHTLTSPLCGSVKEEEM
jgi:hypothetical protein